jgi:hypothetical protein
LNHDASSNYQEQQTVVITQQQQLQELRHIHDMKNTTSHLHHRYALLLLQQNQQRFEDESFSEELGNVENVKTSVSSMSFGDHRAKMNVQMDSSSDSDYSNQGRSAFVRADIHTTRKADQEHGSSSLGSISASSLSSSVASSREFEGQATRSELINSPVHSNMLESGIHLR